VKFLGPILLLDDVGENTPVAPLLPPTVLGLYRRGNSIYTRIGTGVENPVGGTSIGNEIIGATPYSLLYADANGNLGNSTDFMLSPDYDRLLLGNVLDDGSSLLQLDGNLTFQTGVIGSLVEPAQTTIAYTGQIIMGTGPTGPVTVHFVGGANDGVSIAATGYQSYNPYCTVYFLGTPPPFVPLISDTYRLSLVITSPLYTIGQDIGNNWYYPYLASAQPSSWIPGPDTGTFTNGANIGQNVSLFFQTWTGSIFTVFIPVPRGSSPNPAGTSTDISATPITSVDPINRVLYADDGITPNLNWATPGVLGLAGVNYTMPTYNAVGQLVNNGSGGLSWAPTTAPVTLTNGATVTPDVSQGTVFYLTATQATTISAPLNPIDGQRIIIAFTASGANRQLILASGAGGFTFGSAVPSLGVTTSGETDYLGCIYNAALNTWAVLAYSQGF
jgi:hypothetical protein